MSNIYCARTLPTIHFSSLLSRPGVTFTRPRLKCCFLDPVMLGVSAESVRALRVPQYRHVESQTCGSGLPFRLQLTLCGQVPSFPCMSVRRYSTAVCILYFSPTNTQALPYFRRAMWVPITCRLRDDAEEAATSFELWVLVPPFFPSYRLPLPFPPQKQCANH